MTVTLAEIQAKCTAALLASRDTTAIAEQVSAGRTKTAPVSAASVRGMLYALGKWSGIVGLANAARANTDITPVARACQTLYDLAASDQPIPMDNPAISAAVGRDLDLMVTALLLSVSDKTSVLSLASAPNPVSEFDVRVACYDAAGKVWVA